MFKRIFWGIVAIVFAVLLVLEYVGISIPIFSSVPLWKIFLLLIFLYWIIKQIIKRNFFLVFFPLAILAMVYERHLVEWFNISSGDIAPWWGFLLVALLLTVGFSLLTKNTDFNVIKSGDGEQVNSKNCATKSVNNLKSSILYIDCGAEQNTPLKESIENNLGSTSVYFVNTEKYEGNGMLTIDNNLGSLTIFIPKDWVVISHIDNSLGSVVTPPPIATENKKSITINGDNNLGSLVVKYLKKESE